jgi:predicted transcriptional regulator
MLLPAEIESKVTIPLVRALVAKKLVTEKMYTQEQVAKVLGVTQAAVSNYLRGVRGLSVELKENQLINNWVNQIVETILSNRPRQEIAKKINEAVEDIRRQRMLCEIHKKLEPDIDVDSCKVCE